MEIDPSTERRFFAKFLPVVMGPGLRRDDSGETFARNYLNIVIASLRYAAGPIAASASAFKVAKWKSGLVSVSTAGVPPKPAMPWRRSIQHTL